MTSASKLLHEQSIVINVATLRRGHHLLFVDINAAQSPCVREKMLLIAGLLSMLPKRLAVGQHQSVSLGQDRCCRTASGNLLRRPNA